MIAPLILVRSWSVVPVPPVCSVYWTPADWARVTRRTCEPLILHTLGTWFATGDRNSAGQLLYRRVAP